MQTNTEDELIRYFVNHKSHADLPFLSILYMKSCKTNYTLFYVPYVCLWFHTLSKWVPLEHISGINSARENGTHLGNDDRERETLDGQSFCEGVPIMLQYSGEDILISWLGL